MRWLKRSARKEILKGISFNKRGEESVSTPQEKSRTAPIMKIFVLFILLIAIVAGVGFFTSDRGQRFATEGVATIKSLTIDKASDFIASIFEFGAQEHFGSTVNSSSTKQGVDLADFVSVTGQRLPAGATVDFEYKFSFSNVKSSDAFDAEFACSLNSTAEDEGLNIPGEIIPDSQTTISKGSAVFCRFSGDDTEGLDGEYIAYGGYKFEDETKDAIMNVYFISDTVNEQLQARDEDFFDAYNLDVSSSDLKVIYNGEPIGIAVGVGAAGEEGQPVVVSTGETPVYNTIGITLENKWNGDIADLKEVTLTLPEGVTLNDELNGVASLGCPFISFGTDRGTGDNVYILDESVRENIFDFYLQDHSFFGKADKHTFQCWVNIEEDFVGEAPYVKDKYRVDAKYVYTVKNAVEAVTFVSTEVA